MPEQPRSGILLPVGRTGNLAFEGYQKDFFEFRLKK